MISIQRRRILINGRPELLFCGEVHYFRTARKDWEERIRQTVDCGCNAFATYIPWLVHEQAEGDFDLDGRHNPSYAIGEFIDLCHKHGLWFIARPGPFQMAELKNEGIPSWVYKKHPDAVPITWDGERARSKTLDLLHPGFLADAKRWYSKIMPVVADRLIQKGGPVIGVQLDNEIGMLSWVNNQPELTESALCLFAEWLGRAYKAGDLKLRYPFDLNDPSVRAKKVRTPEDAYAGALHTDLSLFFRWRIARYAAELRGYAEEYGVRNVPFIINIHGTGGGRGTTFPIGIHHLVDAYTQAPGYLSGSDHYLGEITRENASDLHYINCFMAAGHRPEQPLTSMEFEVGTADYGETGGSRLTPAAADFKIRMSLMQDNRLLNYYLLGGGRNPKLNKPVGDGNDRIAFTGERHGFAAPINPEGRTDANYDALAETTKRMGAAARWMADMDEEHDALGLGFMAGLYMTDFRRPGPISEIVGHMEGAREHLERLTRAALFCGLRYTGIDLEKDPAEAWPKVVMAASARVMAPDVQQRLVRHMRSGGSVVLMGEMPVMDLELRPCLIVAEALGAQHEGFLQASSDFHLSVAGRGWAAFQPEIRVWRGQAVAPGRAGSVFLQTLEGQACGLEFGAGEGKCTLLLCNYPVHLPFFRELFRRAGVSPGLRHDWGGDGLVLQSTGGAEGRFVSLINLDNEHRSLRLEEGGAALFKGTRVELAGKSAKLLPLGLKHPLGEVVGATTEIRRAGNERVEFAATGFHERVWVRPSGRVRTEGGQVSEAGGVLEAVIRPGESFVLARG